MAAKPTKPPGDLLSRSNINNNHNKGTITNVNVNISGKCINKFTPNHNSEDNDNNNNQQHQENLTEQVDNKTPPPLPRTTPPPLSQIPLCPCTNISIMHLFHEMKQEFPTIPDHIVTQCVNENCHQRENCVSALKRELIINPMPVQTYPAKQVIDKQQQHRERGQKLVVNKPIRVAPLIPTSPSPSTITSKKTTAADKTTATSPSLGPAASSKVQFLNKTNSNCDIKAKSIGDDQNDEVIQSKIINYNNNSSESICENHNISNCSDLLQWKQPQQQDNIFNKDVHSNQKKQTKFSDYPVKNLFGECDDMPAIVNATTTTLSTTTQNVPIPTLYEQQQELDEQQQHQHQTTLPQSSTSPAQAAATTTVTAPPLPEQAPSPRVRPTTLNLQTQQRLQQQQLQLKRPQKPLRKAPLPPLPPKPINASPNAAYLQTHLHYNNSNGVNNNICSSGNITNYNSHYNSANNKSNESSCVNSPSGSIGSGSEFSVNVSLSSPSAGNANIDVGITNSNHHHFGEQQLKSPIRHRSVINVQPALPYTCDYFGSPTRTAWSGPAISTPPPAPTSSSVASTPSTISSPTHSNSNCNQKSFTSVNLILRQPTTTSSPSSPLSAAAVSASAASAAALAVGAGACPTASGIVPAHPNALAQTTIDIKAGPNSNGSGGLIYSSTSYNAQLGVQKNFQITVTDAGGVFSSSRIGPQNYASMIPSNGEMLDGNGGGAGAGAGGNATSPLRSPENMIMQQQHLLQQQILEQQQLHRLYTQREQQQQQKQTLADDVSLAKEFNAVDETLLRQKDRRDKLASVLRDNKKKMDQIDREIIFLIDEKAIDDDYSNKMDIEIQEYRNECQAMINELENARKCAPKPIIHRPAPFPPQRPRRRAPSSISNQQTENLDFIQHHTNNNYINHANTTTTTPAFGVPATTLSPMQQATATSPNQQYSLQPQQIWHSNNSPLSGLIHSQMLPSNLHQPSYSPSTPPQQQQFQSYQRNPSITSSQPYDHYSGNDDVIDNIADDDNLVNNDDCDDDDEAEETEMWDCNMCTFRNHPQLNICECCENIRIPAPTTTMPMFNREDIHITLSPGENRIIHSWIVS